MTTIAPEKITVASLEEVFNLEENLDEGKDKKAHIVNPPNNLHIWKPGMSAQDIVDLARINGWKVRGLCGYVWVPKHTPGSHESCEPCMAEAMRILREAGE